MDIYVSPNGQGQAGSEKEPCSLEGARDLVRTHNQTMTGCCPNARLHGIPKKEILHYVQNDCFFK
jgi:hypothetical protein